MSNFLSQYKRQPKIYIDLPSKGIFYDENIIQDKQFTEMPVFGMNTMDEILIKTPDALFSGESTAQIIRSCIPIIKNPWDLVGFDIDFVLIAIRIATYGDSMPVQSTCPHCGNATESDLILNHLLAEYTNKSTFYSVDFQELRLDLRPLNYKMQTQFAKKQYMLERQIVQIDKTTQTDDEKNVSKQKLMKQMTELNAEMIITHIFNISNRENEREFDFTVIKDFVINNDASIFNDVQEKIKQMNKDWSLPTFEVSCANESCKKQYTSSINVDYASFFGDTSLRSRTLRSNR